MQLDVPSGVLRNDGFRLAVGELIAVAGIVALALQILRRRNSDRSAVWFGLASLLYGLRLILGMDAIHAAFPRVHWDVVVSAITLVVSYPFVLFLGTTLARAYKWYTRTVVVMLAIVTVDGAARLTMHAPMDQTWFLNGVVTVASVIGWVAIGIFPRIPVDSEVRALRIGLLVMGASSIYQNLWVMGVLPPAAWVEPLGVAFMLGTFFFVTAVRSLRVESHLIGLRNELEIARRIQTQLLPRLDGTIAGMNVHARYSPMGSVAGDFYDVLEDQRGLGVLIADVSGHGVPAALTASMVKVALRAQVEHLRDPAEVLRGLNCSLTGTVQGQFITAAYVYIDSHDCIMRYAGAGHPPVLVWRAATGRVESLEENGLFLGPFPAAEYNAVCVPFERGDRCLLYTDGVLEAANREGEEFGAERLCKFLERHGGEPSAVLCQSLLNEVAAWSGAGAENQQDDITFVALEFAHVEAGAATGAVQAAL